MRDLVINPMFLVIISALVSLEIFVNFVMVGNHKTDSFYSAFRKISAVIIGIGLPNAIRMLDLASIISLVVSIATLAILIATAYSVGSVQGEAMLVSVIIAIGVSTISMLVAAFVSGATMFLYPRIRKSSENRIENPKRTFVDMKAILIVTVINICVLAMFICGFLV